MTSAVTAGDMHKAQLMKSVAEIRKKLFIDIVGLNCYHIGTSIGLFNSILIAILKYF